MATQTATITDSGAASRFSLRLPHHDKDYLPVSKYNTIDGLLKVHASEPDQIPLICYPRSGTCDYEEHSASDIDRYTDAAVQYYIRVGLSPADPNARKAPVVALLAKSSFEYVISIFALNRLGWTALFLSTRLAASACARLLDLADCSTVIVPDPSQPIVDDIKQQRICTAIPIVQREDYRGDARAPFFSRPGLDASKEAEKVAWILHSSGSTGFPKPIFLTNTACLANFRKSFGLRAFCISPLFHSHGLMELGRAFYTRAPMYLGNHSLPVTSQNLLEALEVAKPQQVCAVPYVLQLLAEKEEGTRALAAAKLVLFAGSSCPDELGNRLVAKGVNLVANYGCTEIGQIMTSFRPPRDDEWQYMRLHSPPADFTLMDEIAPGVFECVGLEGLPSKGPTTNAKPPYSPKNPENSFRSGDLFTRHPDPKKSNYYKYLSRLDDRLTLVNGEKILPIPIEGSIRQDELVREVVVFGVQRTVPGAIIFRSGEAGLELTDTDFLESVWPSVEAANLQAESFARIPKEMIIVQGADVRYPRTDKGTFIRAQVYQQFAKEIDSAYARFESTAARDCEKLQLEMVELQEWLLAKFVYDLGVELPNADSDIFSAGVDSLQTTRLWRMIKTELDLGSGAESLTQNIVYEKGTVRRLAEHLYNLRVGGSDQDIDGDPEITIMEEMIEKYSHFAQHVPSRTKQPDRHTILLTGATGNLGAFVLDELTKLDQVGEVWALVRAPGQAAAGGRLMDSLAVRNISLSNEQHRKVRAMPSDLSQADLGLAAHDLDYLLNTLTCVIHSAWAVNFNLGVSSFEAQHMRGVQNLINLCLRSRLRHPASFFFCSSISAAGATPKPALVPETAVDDLNHAQKMGYGRSKLVAEHITRNAMRKTGMHARVLRIGQLSGDTLSADWNDTEAIPLMVRSALVTGALPRINERPSWLPVDTCAKAIVELSLLSKVDQSRKDDADLVYHLVNPKTFSFEHDFLPKLAASRMPKFDVVELDEWLRRLACSDNDVEKNPSIKLLDFWRSKYGQTHQRTVADQDREPISLTFDTTRTVHDAPSLATITDPVSAGLIERYVDSWLESWIKQPNLAKNPEQRQ